MEAATFCGSAATACLRAGDEEGALSYLERFVGLLKRFDLDGLLFPRRSALFDLVPELAETDVEREQATADTLFGGLDMKEQCKLAVTGDAAWERVADDAGPTAANAAAVASSRAAHMSAAHTTAMAARYSW